MQDSGSLDVFKVTARDQGHYKGPLGAFITYCNISCFLLFFFRLDVFKVTARDQGHYKGPLGAFVTYCNISCFFFQDWMFWFFI